MPWNGNCKETSKEKEMIKEELSRSQIEELINEWILSERDRAIVKRRMIDGLCYEPLAEEFDLSVRQVKKIVYKAQEKIFRHV